MTSSAAEMGWLDTIVGVSWPSSGWLGLSIAVNWKATFDYDDVPTLQASSIPITIDLTVGGKRPSAQDPIFSVAAPYHKSTPSVITITGFNVTRETILGALKPGQPYLFGETFTGTSNADIFAQALDAFAASAVSRGFYPDIATAKANIFLASLTDVAPPDPTLILTPYTTTEVGVSAVVNLFVYINLSLAKTAIGNNQTEFDFTVTFGPPVNPGTYTWTAIGKSFKVQPPWTLDNKGLPVSSWWNSPISSDSAVSTGVATTLNWTVNLNTLQVNVL